MNERDFLEKLEKRAHEQQQLVRGVLLPRVFSFIAMWLGVHPWRILIPTAFFLSLVLHFGLGEGYDNLIFKIFGGFGIIHIGEGW